MEDTLSGIAMALNTGVAMFMLLVVPREYWDARIKFWFGMNVLMAALNGLFLMGVI